LLYSWSILLTMNVCDAGYLSTYHNHRSSQLLHPPLSSLSSVLSSATPNMDISSVKIGLTCILGLTIIFRIVLRASRYPLPPGPPRLPLIGNVLQMPTERAWITFAFWGKKYGSIMYLSVLGQSIIVLNSPDVVIELLERRNRLYSDRPLIPMAGELLGYSKFIALEPYGSRHRDGRKLLMSGINKSKGHEYSRSQEAKVIQLVLRLSKTPDRFLRHIRWFVASLVIQITYGHNAESDDDSLIALGEQVMDDFGAAVRPGAFLVDSLPILQHVPSWFPGAGFKVVAKQMRQHADRLRDEPYSIVKEKLLQGIAPICLTTTLIENNKNPSPEEEDLWKTTALALFAGGADTVRCLCDTSEHETILIGC